MFSPFPAGNFKPQEMYHSSNKHSHLAFQASRKLRETNSFCLHFFSSNTKNETSEDMADGLDELDDRLIIDPHNVEASFAFQDAKRKLRMMLSEADMSIPSTSIGKSRIFILHSLIREVLIQSCSAGAKKFTNYLCILSSTIHWCYPKY